MEASTHRRLKLVQLAWDLAFACAIVAMGAGVWFAFMAWKFASAGYGMAAVLAVMLAPVAAVAVVVARQGATRAQSEPRVETVIDDIERIEATLRLIKVGRAHVAAVSSYVVILWICETTGMLALGNFLVFFTSVCTVTAVTWVPWLSKLEQRQHEKRAQYRELLGELEAGAR